MFTTILVTPFACEPPFRYYMDKIEKAYTESLLNGYFYYNGDYNYSFFKISIEDYVFRAEGTIWPNKYNYWDGLGLVESTRNLFEVWNRKQLTDFLYHYNFGKIEEDMPTEWLRQLAEGVA